MRLLEKSWDVNKNMENEVKVSVLCMAYNHAKYIRKCLDGFVMQKTNFKYEVLINDDASTDNTAEIIKEYEEKYPDIIKPIYQTENQYSKGVKIVRTILAPKAQGKYFAFCEGDDYWCDESKLQKQYDFLEKHSEYALCAHRTVYKNLKNDTERIFPENAMSYSIEEIIKMGGSGFATNSCFMTIDAYKTMPQSFHMKSFGDYQLFIWGTICGDNNKMMCLPETMSVYNIGTMGSWTSNVVRNNDKAIEYRKEVIALMDAIDGYFDNKYFNATEKVRLEMELKILLLQKNYKQAISKKYKKQRKQYSKRLRLSIYLHAYFPRTIALLKKVK